MQNDNPNLLLLTPILRPTTNGGSLILDTRYDTLKQYPSGNKEAEQNQHIYLTSSRTPKVGGWCMFYNQPSKVLEINGSHAKIETHGIVSENDAETINSIKGEGTVKVGDPCVMVHSFGLSQMQNIELTTDPKLIADGVLKIDAMSTKSWIPSNNKNPVFPNEITQVNFLEEYCKRYNLKYNQKYHQVNPSRTEDGYCKCGRPIEHTIHQKDEYKLKRDELGCYSPQKDKEVYVASFDKCYPTGQSWGDVKGVDNPIKELLTELKETFEKCLPEFKAGIQHSILRASAYLENQAPKSTGQYGLPTEEQLAKKLSELKDGLTHPQIAFEILEFIQSLQPQSKGDIVIEYNKETQTIIFK